MIVLLSKSWTKYWGVLIAPFVLMYSNFSFSETSPFSITSFLDKKISENQFVRLLQKGSTVNLKGFKINENEVEGLVRFDENFNLKLEEKKATKSTSTTDSISCPTCKKGTVLKGKTAYGCSEYKNNCDFIFSFDEIRKKANGKQLTKELVLSILNGN